MLVNALRSTLPQITGIWMVLAVWTAPALAQTNLGSVLGTVRDSSGAVIPGAEATARNVGTGQERSVITDDSGNYVITALHAGDYVVSCSLAGFESVRTESFTLHVGQTRRVDFTLRVTAESEEVTVNARPDEVQTDTSSRSTLIASKEVVNLPLNGRNFEQLLQLAPGVEAGGNVNGSRRDLRSFLLNGANFTETREHRPTTAPSIDAIEEFSFEQSMAPAKFAQGAAGVVNINLKSGTNDWHGTLFEFHRNDALNARNFFSASKPPALKQHQFGFVLGGPVIRDKTFFLVNYEGFRSRAAAVRTSRVPSAKERQGDFSETAPVYNPLAPLTAGGKRQRFPNDVIPQNQWHPFARGLLQYFPEANFQSPTGTTNYLNDTPGKQVIDQYNTRVDHHFDPQNSLAVSVVLSFRDSLNPGHIPVVSDQLDVGGARVATLQYSRVLSPTFVSLSQLTFNRRRDSFETASKEPIASSLGIPVDGAGVDGFPLVSISDRVGLNSTFTNLPFIYNNNNWEVKQDFNKSAGRHNLSFGSSFTVLNFNQQITTSSRGRTSFSGQFTSETPGTNHRTGWGDFLLGLPNTLQMEAGSAPVYARRRSVSTYIQDDWKVTPRLTLNVGLRHEMNFPWKEHRLKTAIFELECGCLTYMKGAPLPPNFNPPYPFRTDGPTGLGKTHLLNLAPRLGFAWSPFGKGSTVIRGGYGIFFDSPTGAVVAALGNAFPFRGNLILDSLRTTPTLRIPQDYPNLNALVPGAITAFGIDTENFPDPYVQQWNLTIEQRLPWNLVSSIAYVGTKGTHLLDNDFVNIPEPGPGPIQPRRPYPAFSRNVQLRSPVGNSNYHAFQATAVKRLGHGLFFQSAYSLGKSIDIRSNDQFGGQQDPRNRRGNRGRSNYDIRHRFSTGFDYQLPFGQGRTFLASAPRVVEYILGGWYLGGIVVTQSGYPFTVTSPTTSLGTDAIERRADRLGHGQLAPSDRTLVRWFKTEDFREPGPLLFGTGGRNILDGPGRINLDMSLRKTFPVMEGHSLELRGEFFNMPNHPNFGGPTASTNSQFFGRIGSAASGRVIQFALKYRF